MFYYLGNNKGILKTNLGLKLYVDSSEKSITPHLITDSQWEPNITKFITSVLKPGMNVVEIGANIGYYSTIIAAKIGPQGHLWSFEPNSEVYKLLKLNLEINGYSDRSSSIHGAVSDSSGMAQFTALEDHKVSSSLMCEEDLNSIEARKYENESRSFEFVNTYHLDNPALGFNGAQIDLLKMDAEGFEWKIFEGAQEFLSRNPKLQMIVEFVPEYLNLVSENGAEKLLDMVLSRGYSLKWIDDQGRPIVAPKEELLGRHYSELYLVK